MCFQTISAVFFGDIINESSLEPLKNTKDLLRLVVVKGFIASRIANWSPLTRTIHDSQTRQIAIKMIVIGIVVARKSHQSSVTTTSPLWLLKNTMPKKPETAVAGRKTMVNAAMIFIAELSALVARAMEVFVSLSCWVTKLKTCLRFSRMLDCQGWIENEDDLRDSWQCLSATCSLRSTVSSPPTNA